MIKNFILLNVFFTIECFGPETLDMKVQKGSVKVKKKPNTDVIQQDDKKAVMHGIR